MSNYPKAAQECDYILYFLWAAASKRMPKLDFVTNQDDLELQQWGQLRRVRNILPPSTLPNPTEQGPSNASNLDELTLSIRTQTSVLEQFHQDRKEEKDKKNKFDNLHESTQRLILNASSLNGERTPDKPVELCKQISLNQQWGKPRTYRKP